MPLNENCCRECEAVFEARRPMADADAPLLCPSGHARVARKLSVFATSRASAAQPSQLGAAAPCGPACACHPG
jgi:putative FmdB family regulatory protein